MQIHATTPLIDSTQLSRRTGLAVSLKLECTQPSGSFKLRGVAHLCQVRHAQGARQLVSSSGGNAGYAVAYAGRRLNMPVTVVVPQYTSERARALIASEGATVLVHGSHWQEANDKAQSLVENGMAFVHPFDDPLLWEGHASMIDEMVRQTAQQNVQRPDAIICSVGGGGLLAGVAEGLLRNGWSDVGVLAAETEGAASYAAALAAGQPVNIGAIHTLATSLGASQVCERSVELAGQLAIRSQVLSDAAAIQGCVDLIDMHRLVTEPACGVSVAALDAVRQHFPAAQRVSVIVCGGVGATDEQLRAWQKG